jgi:tetratricopeptide (TPR) repeat protein
MGVHARGKERPEGEVYVATNRQGDVGSRVAVRTLIMKSSRLPLLLVVLITAVTGFGQVDDNAQRMENDLIERQIRERPSKVDVDPKRLVSESNSFLKEREPEMTAEEYALYETVVTMLGTKPAFALKLLEGMADEKEKPSPAFEFILGNAYYAAGELDKSEASYRAALERYPSFLRAWNNLGVLYYSKERYADAARCFSKSVGLGDREPTTFGLLAYSLERESNFVSAEVAYLQAISGDPTNVEWKEGLLRICIQGGQFERAESIVKNLIKEQPAETRFWLTYANILVSERRKLEAIAVLEAASGVGIAGVEELTMLGDLYAESNLIAEATAIYQKVLKPSAAMAHERLLRYAEVLIAEEKYPEAERVLAVMKGELPATTHLAFLQTKADLFMAKKQWANARREIEALLKIAPLNGRALLTLGSTYAHEDDIGRAIFAFESAYQISDSTYRASLELANLQIKNRDYASSVKYLEKALSIRQTDAVADYLARIKTLVVNDG